MVGKKDLSKRCNLTFLKLLKKLNDEERSYLITRLLSDSAVDLLGSCVYNALYCDFKIPTKTRKKIRKKLGKQAKLLDYAAQRSNPVKKRCSQLSQAGYGTKFERTNKKTNLTVNYILFRGGIGLLLGALIPVR